MRGRRDASSGVYVLTREASRRLDELARTEFAMPPIVLMENAARHAADVALEGLERVENPRVLVVCGSGNNGGDGMATARHLHNAGLLARVVLSCDPNALMGEARTNYEIARAMGLVLGPLEAAGTQGGAREALLGTAGALEPDLVIDGLLGTGLTRPVEGAMAGLISGLNEIGDDGVSVLSLDVPSGLDADTGRPLGAAVRAAVTVTFAGLKAGFLRLDAQGYLGEVVVGDIGVPRELVERLGRPLAGLGPGSQVREPKRRRGAQRRSRGR